MMLFSHEDAKTESYTKSLCVTSRLCVFVAKKSRTRSFKTEQAFNKLILIKHEQVFHLFANANKFHRDPELVCKF